MGFQNVTWMKNIMTTITTITTMKLIDIVETYKKQNLSATASDLLTEKMIKYCIAFAGTQHKVDNVELTSNTPINALWDHIEINWDSIETVTGKSTGELLVLHVQATQQLFILPDGKMHPDMRPYVKKYLSLVEQ